MTNKKSDDTIISEYEYEYDANNNITKKTDEKGQTTYTYDSLNRILTSNNNGKGTTYTYDNRGNISQKVESGTGTTTTYTYNAKNQLTKELQKKGTSTLKDAAYTYDANGNQLTAEEQGWEYLVNQYNARNELVYALEDWYTSTESTYKYNAEGKRIEKSYKDMYGGKNAQIYTTKFVYEGINVILELDANGNQKAQNVYGLALTARTIKATTGYYLYNGHGDVERIFSQGTKELNKYYYDEYGKITQETGAFDNPYRYAGYYYDAETNNYYLQNRYYNPEIMRFISEDTFRGNPEDPLSLNYYTYAHNNPLKYNDPDGHFVREIIGLVNLAKQKIREVVTDTFINTVKNVANWGKGVIDTIDRNVAGTFSLPLQAIDNVTAQKGYNTNFYGDVMKATDNYASIGMKPEDYNKVYYAGRKFGEVPSMFVIAGIMSTDWSSPQSNTQKSITTNKVDFYVATDGTTFTQQQYNYMIQNDLTIQQMQALLKQWPTNDGFDGTTSTITLKPGEQIDRFGGETGNYAAPKGTSYGERSLKPGSENAQYNAYEVVKSINDVTFGKTAPWFGQLGGGTQYKLPMSIEQLKAQGFIK